MDLNVRLAGLSNSCMSLESISAYTSASLDFEVFKGSDQPSNLQSVSFDS